jgi:LuxR family transcriptional regulator, maltose regulon positive regulatory protein
VRRLASTRDARLVVIVAPPGYGKSTLLSDWAAHDERRFVWVASTDPTARKAHPRLTESIRSATDSIRSLGGPGVLVLDDAHLVEAEVLRTVVDEAMMELPAGSAIALATRTEPALPLGRLRAHRTLVEVRVDDLALTPAEAATLLRRAGLELDFGAVQTLVQRTEGWPAALYLASLSVGEDADASAAARHLRGDDYRLAQYFQDEFLSGLSDSQAEFAVRTSVLTELSGALCDSVLDSRGSGVLLRELEQASPLLRPLDPAHERYSWHGLIRDALQAELRRTEREIAPTLHVRASSWYVARGDTDEAIGHAVGAHDCALSGDLLWAAVVEYVSQGRNSLVQDWLAEFSHQELAGHPPLGLAAAYSFLAAGNAAEARRLAVAVAAATECVPDTVAASSLGAGLAGIEAMVAPAGVAGMAEAAARACALEPRDTPWRPIYLFLHGTALYLSGQSSAAGRLLGEAAELSAASAPAV